MRNFPGPDRINVHTRRHNNRFMDCTSSPMLTGLFSINRQENCEMNSCKWEKQCF
jgi:hypothetical protein